MIREVSMFMFTISLFFILSIQSVSAYFPDVTHEQHLYSVDIQRLEKINFIKGDENGNFNPEKGISRCEMAKLTLEVYQAFNSDSLIIDNTIPLHAFPDIPQGHWCDEKASTLKYFQMIQGNEKGSFEPWRFVTLAEGIKMLINAAQIDPDMANMEGYSGAEGWQKAYMSYAFMNELEDQSVLSGYTRNFQSNTVAKRKVIARIIRRLLDHKENSYYKKFDSDFPLIFSYPKEYLVEEFPSSVIISQGSNRFNFKTISKTDLDTQISNCNILGTNTIFDTGAYTQFSCDGGNSYGYYINMGQFYLYGSNENSSRDTSDFEDIFSSMKNHPYESVSWEEFLRVLYTGEAYSGAQFHDLSVSLSLKNGENISSKEPFIDAIFNEVVACGEACQDLRIMTE